MLVDLKVTIDVDATGDSVDSPDWWPGFCYLEAIILDFGTLAANMDFVLTTVGHGTQTFFTKENQGAADAIWYPRVKCVDGADASALADADGNAYTRILLDSPPIITTADGGVSLSGVMWLIVDVPER